MEKYSQKEEDDEYINMDISFDATHSSREFEFKMPSDSLVKETSSPADELFYKGKLLPLHIPLRLQMLQNLHHNPTTISNAFEKPTPSPCMSSCNVYIEEFKTKKFWSRKLNLIKKSSLTRKLKATKTYLQSLFATKVISKEQENDMNSMSVISILRSIERERMQEEECKYRKSFSGAINCDFMNKSSSEISSSSSSSSSSFSSVHSSGIFMINRSGSGNFEMEKSILGAIEYCKKSHIGTARKSLSM